MMLKRVISMKETFNTWISKDPKVGKVVLDHDNFGLSNAEWKLLMRFTKHLEFFFFATKHVSAGIKAFSSLSFLFPAFICLFGHIENCMKDASEDPNIKLALTEAHGVLRKYYT